MEDYWIDKKEFNELLKKVSKFKKNKNKDTKISSNNDKRYQENEKILDFINNLKNKKISKNKRNRPLSNPKFILDEEEFIKNKEKNSTQSSTLKKVSISDKSFSKAIKSLDQARSKIDSGGLLKKITKLPLPKKNAIPSKQIINENKPSLNEDNNLIKSLLNKHFEIKSVSLIDNLGYSLYEYGELDDKIKYSIISNLNNDHYFSNFIKLDVQINFSKNDWYSVIRGRGSFKHLFFILYSIKPFDSNIINKWADLFNDKMFLYKIRNVDVKKSFHTIN